MSGDDDMDELKDKIESTVVTRTFHVSGMPESVFKEIDAFCKEFYGDSRWNMIADLVRASREDYKFSILYDEVYNVKQRVSNLEEAPKDERKAPKIKTFGAKKGELK